MKFKRKPEYRVQAGAVQVVAGRAFRKFLWFFDRVLTERSAAETVTKDSVKPLVTVSGENTASNSRGCEIRHESKGRRYSTGWCQSW